MKIKQTNDGSLYEDHTDELATSKTFKHIMTSRYPLNKIDKHGDLITREAIIATFKIGDPITLNWGETVGKLLAFEIKNDCIEFKYEITDKDILEKINKENLKNVGIGGIVKQSHIKNDTTTIENFEVTNISVVDNPAYYEKCNHKYINSETWKCENCEKLICKKCIDEHKC